MTAQFDCGKLKQGSSCIVCEGHLTAFTVSHIHQMENGLHLEQDGRTRASELQTLIVARRRSACVGMSIGLMVLHFHEIAK
jgi:hypothetical protein